MSTKSKKSKGSETCKHPLRIGDPHPICEGCRRARFGADSLCTPTNRCFFCQDLSEEQFAELIRVRERNEHKNSLKRKMKSVSLPSSPQPSAPFVDDNAAPADLSLKTPLPDEVQLQVKSEPRMETSVDDVKNAMDEIRAQAEAALTVDFERASYNQLLHTGRDAVKFCSDRNLHVSTLRWAISSSQLLQQPLVEISRMVMASDTAAVAATKQSCASSALASVPDPATEIAVRKSPRLPKPSAAVSTATVSNKVAKKATAPVVLQKSPSFKLETKRIKTAPSATRSKSSAVVTPSRSSSSSASSVLEDPLPRDSQEQLLGDIRAITPVCADRSFDGDPLGQGGSTMLDLRRAYELIAEAVPSVETRPTTSSSSAPALRSALQGSVDAHVRVGLTTQPLLKDCVEARQRELKQAELDRKAKELSRMTNSEALKVKTHMYVPGDDVWGIKAPPLNEGFQPWLPLVDKQHRVSMSYNDTMNVESLARVLQRNGAIIESTLLALSPFLEPFEDNDDCSMLHSLLGSLVRDNVKLSTDLATRMFQLRRDTVLAKATFDEEEVKQLRYSQYTDLTQLFDPALLVSVRDAARKRVQDKALQRSMQ